MKDQAQVVIIGGGVFGTSVAYHLAKAGCTDVVLVDKGELTSGTTFHSVGLVSQFRTSPSLMRVMNYTIKLFNELKAEVGDSLGWHTVGSLRLASSAERLKGLKREVSRAKAIGIEADIISPEEALKIAPCCSIFCLALMVLSYSSNNRFISMMAISPFSARAHPAQTVILTKTTNPTRKCCFTLSSPTGGFPC